MLRKLLAATATAAAAVVTVPAYAGTVDFDSYSVGDILAGDTWISEGFVFDQSLVVVDGSSGAMPKTGVAVANNDSFGGSITGYMAGPLASAYFLSVYVGDAGGDVDHVVFNAYDINDVLIASDSYIGRRAQPLILETTGMVRFEILSDTGIGIDNFRLHGPVATQVPEPQTYALMLLGLAGMAAVARRKRS